MTAGVQAVLTIRVTSVLDGSWVNYLVDTTTSTRTATWVKPKASRSSGCNRKGAVAAAAVHRGAKAELATLRLGLSCHEDVLEFALPLMHWLGSPDGYRWDDSGCR